MEIQQLQQLIQQLHRELANHQIDNAQIQAQLQTLMQTIDKQVNNAAQPSQPGDELSDLAIELETEFPRLSSIIREITDQLSKLGI